MYKIIRIVLLSAVLFAGVRSRDARAMKEVVGSFLIAGGFCCAGLGILYNYCTIGVTNAWLHAASDGDLEALKKFVADGIDVDIQGSGNNTALHMAAFSGHQKLVVYLIGQGAAVSIKNHAGATPLHLAAFAGHRGMVKLLVAAGADITQTDTSGMTPLQNTQDLPVIAYLTMVTDFHQVMGGTLGFDAFATRYFGVQDKTKAKNNRADICRIVHLGSQTLADTYYTWLVNHNCLPKQWAKGRQWMYADFLTRPGCLLHTLRWCTLCWGIAEKVNDGLLIKRLVKEELEKPVHSQLAKIWGKIKSKKELKNNLAGSCKSKSTGFSTRFPVDLKIMFKK